MKSRLSVNFFLTVISLLLVAAQAAIALRDPGISWDNWAYHLPFSSYLWDIGGGTKGFYMIPEFWVNYQGFPKLAEWLQGLFWKLTDNLHSLTMPNIFIMALLLFYVGSYTRMRLAFFIPAILAFPLVLVHFQSAYIDFFMAAALAIEFCAALMLVRLDALKRRPKLRRAWWFHLTILCLSAAAACQTKLYAVPPAMVFIIFVLWKCHQDSLPAFFRTLLVIAAFSPLIGYKYWYNIVQFGNPIYPFIWQVGNFKANGAYTTQRHLELQPKYVPIHIMSRPILFAVSVTEIDWLIRHRPFRYSLHMSAGDEGAHKMRTGGLFAPYLLLQLVCLVWLYGKVEKLAGPRRLQGMAAVQLFGTLTLAIAFLPLNHELRYYLIWPLALVITNGSLLRLLRVRWETGANVAALLICLCISTQAPVSPPPWRSNYAELDKQTLRRRIPPYVRKALNHDVGIVCWNQEPDTKQFRFAPAIVGGTVPVLQRAMGDTRCPDDKLP